jgi:hypothetical protein
MRVISWQDGMFIHPNHFQQQDLCWKGPIGRYHNASSYLSWGMLETCFFAPRDLSKLYEKQRIKPILSQLK